MSLPPEFVEPEDVVVVETLSPPPPSLHWAWVFVLSFVTLGWFWSFWLYKQSAWIQRLRGQRSVYGWAIVQLAITSLALLCLIGSLIAGKPESSEYWGGAAMAFGLVVAFELQSDLQATDPELRLSGVMTFFFGAVYIQYWLNRWRR